ncbi:MAG: biotin--[acetyl-CoA-carboxylase] ligase, partial [Paludibacteraceae bacterium]|nr:biotin--[acetyl-CoA-carboxylase] ligase [Paludibacteraceae bacterium]
VHALEQFFISEAIALAIAEYLDSETDSISVKWPNDIYWREKKICGILIENNLRGAYIKDCVIGAGLNLNQDEFKRDAPNPVSLKNITGKIYSIEDALQQILTKFFTLLELGYADKNALHTRYIERLFRYGEPARYMDKNGHFIGTITAVEPDGHLHIKDSDGCDRRYAFKEVSYIL